MNILPHKSWHVRTKQNIARVRRDEALAAEQEKERQRRIQLAESEARLKILRGKAGSSEETADNVAKTSSFIQFDNSKEADGGHVNFFKDLEDGNYKTSVSNAEYEKEKKQEREQYEKKIGYLTYLGQDTNEALGKRNWYELVPNHLREDGWDQNEEIDYKRKSKDDPLSIVNKALKRDGTTIKSSSKTVNQNVIVENTVNIEKPNKVVKSKKKQSKKRNRPSSLSSSDSSSDDNDNDDDIKKLKLLKLREARLKREREERVKADMLFGKPKSQTTSSTLGPIIKQKYNSQFNPHLARQNFQRN